MIFEALLGLVIFSVSVGPGYLYLRKVEQHKLRSEKTQAEQIAELLLLGVLVTIVSLFITLLTLGKWWNVIDTARLATNPIGYLLTEPAIGLVGLLTMLILSYGSIILFGCYKYGLGP